jgi:hypothetical protein
MELKPDFSFRPLPDIKRPLRFSLETRALVAAAPLGPLQDLPGTWTGKGFNVTGVRTAHRDKIIFWSSISPKRSWRLKRLRDGFCRTVHFAP